MEIAIGLPSTIPDVTGERMLDWSRRAERAGFSSLGTLDRLVYPNYEPLIALAAAAAVTARIRLATAIAILPYRVNAGLVAKQAASIHHLSGGRLVLGVGIGSRGDDYEGTGVSAANRGARFDEMLRELRAVWGGAERGFAGSIGPDVSAGQPQLVIGGRADAAFRRAAELGDGWIMGAATPQVFRECRAKLQAAFGEAGRTESPRAMALQYFALGDDVERDIRTSVRHYYEVDGDYADAVAANVARGPDGARERVKAFEDAGCDELVLFPSSSDPAQVDLLADAVL